MPVPSDTPDTWRPTTRQADERAAGSAGLVTAWSKVFSSSRAEVIMIVPSEPRLEVSVPMVSEPAAPSGLIVKEADGIVAENAPMLTTRSWIVTLKLVALLAEETGRPSTVGWRRCGS